VTRRQHGDDAGSATVAAVVLMLALTGGVLLWLTWNVDRSIRAATDADAIAFQAARSAAQAIDPTSLRTTTPTLRPDTATQNANDTASKLLAGNQTVGRVVNVKVEADRVTVVVEITEAGRTVKGQGTARLATGVTGDNT
jgi:hypothetical protein